MALVLLLLVGSDAAAQAPPVVTAERNLGFGLLTPGVDMVVQPTDVMHRAELLVSGTGTTQIRLVLPTHLVDQVSASSIPLTFSANDGILTIKKKSTRFNPAQPIALSLTPGDKEANIYLGGTARPSTTQVAGQYSASITVMVFASGT